ASPNFLNLIERHGLGVPTVRLRSDAELAVGLSFFAAFFLRDLFGLLFEADSIRRLFLPPRVVKIAHGFIWSIAKPCNAVHEIIAVERAPLCAIHTDAGPV